MKEGRVPRASHLVQVGIRGGLVLLCCVWMILPVRAQESGASGRDPDVLIKLGAELARQERFDEAVTLWLGVLEEVRGEQLTLVHKYLGVAFKRMGRLPESWFHLQACAAKAVPPDATVAALLEEVETELAARHVKVSVRCEPWDAQLILGQRHACPLVWWFPEGQTVVRATREGYLDTEETWTFVATGVAQTKTVVLQPEVVVKVIPVPVEAPADPPSPAVEEAAAPEPVEIREEIVADSSEPPMDLDGIPLSLAEEMEVSGRTAEYALVGSGLFLGVLGGVAHWLAYSRNETLNTQHLDVTRYPYGPEAKRSYDEAYDREVRPVVIASAVMYGVGGGALVAGVLLWVLRDPATGSGENASRMELLPLADPHASGATWIVRF